MTSVISVIAVFCLIVLLFNIEMATVKTIGYYSLIIDFG